MTTENYNGSDCTGTDGDTNRTLTISNSSTTNDDYFEVFVNNSFLHLTTDYTIVHNSSSSVITFLNNLWDEQPITIIYSTSTSYAGVGGAGILPLNSRIYNKELFSLGSTVTIRTITDDSYSKWGDATESTSDSTGVKCMTNVLSQEDELVKEGIFQSGDLVFWFDTSRTDIIRGNRIYYDSLWYEIIEIVKHKVGGNTYSFEARTKKV